MILSLSALVILASSLRVAISLTVYIHIGPAKTGSTHIQNYIGANKAILMSNNICWPAQWGGKALYTVTNIVREKDSPHLNAMRDCLSKNMSVLISAESLSSLSLKETGTFKQLMTDHFTKYSPDFKVIIYYREWLNFIHSFYLEEAKRNKSFGANSFSEFMIARGNLWANIAHYDIQTVTSIYVSTFGMDNVVLVDYYGAEAAAKDIAYIFVCDILRTMCPEASKLNEGLAAHENAQYDEVYVHFVYMMNSFLNTRRQKICAITETFMRTYTSQLANRNVSLPVIQSTVPLLQEMAVARDSRFRADFGRSLLYGNVSANLRKIREFSVSSVDLPAFFSSRESMALLEEEQRRLTEMKVVCPISAPTPSPEVANAKHRPQPKKLPGPKTSHR